MATSASVRAVSHGDREQWLRLWEGYNAFYGRSGATALDPSVTGTTWARFLDPAEPIHALVAERDGELIGLAHYLFHRSTVAIGLNCYLQDLFIGEAARGHGVGRSLISAVFDRAKASGSPRIYWQTHETNHIARKLYDAMAENSGFIVYRKLL